MHKVPLTCLQSTHLLTKRRQASQVAEYMLCEILPSVPLRERNLCLDPETDLRQVLVEVVCLGGNSRKVQQGRRRETGQDLSQKSTFNEEVTEVHG